jgi:hypothetical protein
MNFGPLTGKLFPVVNSQPFVVQIEGTDDFFFMLFSDEELLKNTTEKMMRKLGMTGRYDIGRVTSEQLFDAMRDMGIRLMADPQVVDDHHTQWKEIVKEGEEWKYMKGATK